MTRPADRCSSSTLRSRRPAAQSVVSTGGVGVMMMIRAGWLGGRMFTTSLAALGGAGSRTANDSGSSAPWLQARLDRHGEAVGSDHPTVFVQN